MSDGKIIDFATRKAVPSEDAPPDDDKAGFEPLKADMKIAEVFLDELVEGHIQYPIIIGWDPELGDNRIIFSQPDEDVTPDNYYRAVGSLDLAKAMIEEHYGAIFEEDQE